MVSYDRVCKVRKERYNKDQDGLVVKVPKANNLVMYQENKLDVGRYTNTNENRNSKTDGPVLLLRTTPSGGRHTNKRWIWRIIGSFVSQSSVACTLPYPSSLVTSPAAGVPNTTIPPSPHCPTSHFPLPTSHSRVSKL